MADSDRKRPGQWAKAAREAQGQRATEVFDGVRKVQSDFREIFSTQAGATLQDVLKRMLEAGLSGLESAPNMDGVCLCRGTVKVARELLQLANMDDPSLANSYVNHLFAIKDEQGLPQ